MDILRAWQSARAMKTILTSATGATIMKSCRATGGEAWGRAKTLIAGIRRASRGLQIVAICASPTRANLTMIRRHGQKTTSPRMFPMTEKKVETVETYYPSGKIQSRGTMVDGRWHGVFQRWYESGAPFSEFEYRSGLKHGVLREWSEDGLLLLCATLQDGQLHGPYKSWWDSGLVKEEGNFHSGKRFGRYHWYKVDGSLWRSSDISAD
ncbi:hypothetical protein FJU31_13495 [Stenotrophomonas cyclobalanopsidis]|uniref:Toxin-antitoxin system YwqK family antitoxin n=1 Tax=Stenotrophomonas cyclobalanopsidis TaxID=2771362 RepID=A0ABQ6SYX8_9GAMM|nr:hypothetical protein FJU31_13495 [Stenotrophomonas cyclobalanopsidis]